MSGKVTRREFLGTSGRTAAAGVASGMAIHTVLRDARAAEANEKLTMALIGCGGMGNYDMRDFMRAPEVEIVAVCDVDENQPVKKKTLADVEKKYGKKPAFYKDYRRVIDRKDIDAVIIGTPDHWHAIPMIAACQAGKDVYVEKPCSHNIREGRAMVNAARKYKRVVQVGTQQRSGQHFKDAVEFIQTGKLGTITMTQTFIYGNEAPDGMGQPKAEPTPPGVDYDMWLGPAPKRSFNRHRFHGSFRWFFDYAAGMVGDWNVHLQDIVHWAMDNPFPTGVSASGGKLVLTDDRDTPDTMQAVYEFPGFVQTFTMRKCNGKPWNKGGYGMVFHGTNGTLHLNREGWEVVPDPESWSKKDAPMRCEGFTREGSDQHWPHVQNFLSCVKSRKRPICDIEVNHQSAGACHLANVSLRVGRKIFWDHEKELCYKDAEHRTPDADANRLLAREYRKGYELPKV